MAQGTNARKGSGSAALEAVRETPLEQAAGGTVVVVGGEDVRVGRLTLNQLVALAQVVGGAVAKGRREALQAVVRRRQEAEQDGEAIQATADELVIALSFFDAATVSKIVGIVVERDEHWVGQYVDALGLLEIADALLEQNDLEQLKTVFFRLTKRFQNSPKSAPD